MNVRASNTDGHRRPARPTRRRVLVGLIALASAFTAGQVTSNALFTDQKSVDAGTMAAGTLKLDATHSWGTYFYGGDPLAPGQDDVRALLVSNSGTLPLRYAIESQVTDAGLADTLQLTIRASATCDAATYDTSGTVVFGPAPLSAANGKVAGDKQTGQQPGDRFIAAGSDEQLCFRVSLPASAPNSAQGKTSSATFNLYAEQTFANP